VVIEQAYAKLNLSLNVLEKRTDGFHNLESIMVPVSDLYDTLEFDVRDDNDFVIVDDIVSDNIILKAAKLFQEKYHTKGANIKLIKRIPLEAGLAGGSADASATLRGLNRLFDLNVPLKELEELALSLGSDTVFCLYNKAAVCRGRGEILEFIDFDFTINLWVLRPSFGLLTKDVFKNFEVGQTNIRTTEILNALRENNLDEVFDLISNDLYFAASKVNPKIKEIVDILEENKIKSHMSGSGSTLFMLDNLNTNYKDVLVNNNVEYVYLGKHLLKTTV
jgi:4-diphosphocytidyl-2-C-methyl-D-erythritol kinase